MMQSDNINDLAAALAKAQASITHATKDANNPFFKSKYADLPAVIDAARPHLAANGLSVVQITESFPDGNVTLVTQLQHASGQWIRGTYPVKPVKADPQGLGSAITYARRYAYCAITGVAAAGEDDDGNAASNAGNGKQETATSRNKRYSALKKKIEESADPAATWHENLAEINEFLESDKQFYDDLVQIGGKRKKELEAIAISGNGLEKMPSFLGRGNA
jgi:hypothetical protein